MFSKVVIKYVDSLIGFDEYLVNNVDDVEQGELLTLIKDVKGNFHTINMANVEELSIYDVELNSYLCNYGGTDTAIVYAKNEDDALSKYIEIMQRVYMGIKKEECNCELYIDVNIID